MLHNNTHSNPKKADGASFLTPNDAPSAYIM